MASRNDVRKDFDQATRLRLLENDVDEIEARSEERFERIEARQDRLNGVMVGVLISLTTGSVMLAINIAVNSG